MAAKKEAEQQNGVPPLVLVDGSSYLFRAYHALPDLRTTTNFPTGAVRGVIAMIRKLAKDYEGSPIAVVFDETEVKTTSPFVEFSGSGIIRLGDFVEIKGSVTFGAGDFTVGERWEFYGSYPFLRAKLDEGDLASVDKFCRDCHANQGVAQDGRQNGGYHDGVANWLQQHGAAARQGMESCTTCHQQTECLACHSAKEGWRVNPHGPDFDPERASDRSTQSCRMFIPPVNPTRPSTTKILQWLRKLKWVNVRGSNAGKNFATVTPRFLRTLWIRGRA